MLREAGTAGAGHAGDVRAYGKGLLEKCAGLLGEGEDTVGISLSVRHVAATPVGMKVWCKSCLTQVEGRKLTFHVEAYDEAG